MEGSNGLGTGGGFHGNLGRGMRVSWGVGWDFHLGMIAIHWRLAVFPLFVALLYPFWR